MLGGGSQVVPAWDEIIALIDNLQVYWVLVALCSNMGSCLLNM